MINKIFGIGMYKTGTSSLGQALEHLGFEADYRFWPLFDELAPLFSLDPRVWAPYTKAIRSRAAEYDALCDAPWLYLYRQLDLWFPGSKFILTLRRNAAAVAESDLKMWRRLGLIDRWMAETHQQPEPGLFIERYERHNDNVIRYFGFRGDDLLCMCLETEPRPWERLCRFLGITDVPTLPFPHANRSPGGADS